MVLARAPVIVAEQQHQQHQKAHNTHNTEIAVGIFVVHGAFIGGQQMEILFQPVGQFIPAVSVGGKQQTADTQTVNIGTDGTAVDAVGQRTAHPRQHTQHHGEEIGDHPQDDFCNGQKARHTGGKFAIPQDQAKCRDAQEEAGEIGIVGRAIVGNAPGKGDGQPVTPVAEKAFAGTSEGRVLGTPEAQQYRERHEFHGRQHHVTAQALLHIGTQAEGQPKRKRKPAAHTHHAEYRVAGQRVGKGNNQHIEVEYDAGIFGKQPHEGNKQIIDQIVVGVVGIGRLVKRPPQRAGQVAIAALHLPDPIDSITAVQHRGVPVQPPELKPVVFRNRHSGHQQKHHKALPQYVLLSIQYLVLCHKTPYSPRCIAAT